VFSTHGLLLLIDIETVCAGAWLSVIVMSYGVIDATCDTALPATAQRRIQRSPAATPISNGCASCASDIRAYLAAWPSIAVMPRSKATRSAQSPCLSRNQSRAPQGPGKPDPPESRGARASPARSRATDGAATQSRASLGAIGFEGSHNPRRAASRRARFVRALRGNRSTFRSVWCLDSRSAFMALWLA